MIGTRVRAARGRLFVACGEGVGVSTGDAVGDAVDITTTEVFVGAGVGVSTMQLVTTNRRMTTKAVIRQARVAPTVCWQDLDMSG